MIDVAQIAQALEQHAPAALAESWDNVGLLVGDSRQAVHRVMTCLTITPDTAREAIDGRVDLVVVHHPLPFHALKRVTTETTEGRLLLELIAARVAVYSAHTAFDSAHEGINSALAAGLQLSGARPLVAAAEGELGAGRYGKPAAATTLAGLADQVKKFLNIPRVQVVGDVSQKVSRVAVACGSGGELLAAARASGCDAMVTGETRFHTCLDAEASQIGLVLTGHFASERFGVEMLAQMLAKQFGSVEVWASRRERDPLTWL